MAVVEQELLDGQRAFPQAQRIFAGAGDGRFAERMAVGWHGTKVYPLNGAFAVVREGWGQDELIGEVLRLSTREVPDGIFVYVVGARAVPTDLSLSRRAFVALGRLSLSSVLCVVETT